MRRVKGIYTTEGLEGLRGALKGLDGRYQILLEAGLETGLRISDLRRLKVKDVERIRREGYFGLKMQKTGERVSIAFSEGLMRKLEEYIGAKGLGRQSYVFYSREGWEWKPISRQHCWRLMRAAGLRAGLEGVGTHSMRRTYAVNHYRANRCLTGLQKELGHKYVSSTMSYLTDGEKLLTD